MKNISLLVLFALFILSTANAQILYELNSSEVQFSTLDEQESQFLKTYSDLNRWSVYKQSIQTRLNAFDLQIDPIWENIGPNTIDTLAGRMLCLTFHPDNPDILYAGAGAGGLWRSDNGGDSWIPMTDDLPSFRVSAVAINPNNPDEILIGTGIGQVTSISLQPGVGVLKSTDGGQNWELSSFSYNISDLVSTYKLVYDPWVEDRVYLAATNGFFISEDGGDTWQATNNSRVYDIEMHPTEPGRIFIGTQSVGLQESMNSGQYWSTVTNGLPSGNQIFRTDLAICAGSPDYIVVKMINNNTFNDAGVYRTENGGASWTALSNAPNVSCQPANPNACSGWLFNSIGIAPDDPDKIYIGGVQFWYTHNGGNTWTWKDYLSNGSGENNSNLVYVDHWDLDFHPEIAGRMYVACDGGIIRSEDYGVTWTRKSTDLINAMMYRSTTDLDDPGFMLGGFHDHGLQRWFESSGTTWERWYSNDGINVIIDPQNPGVIYGNAHTGAVIKSYDYGNSVSTSVVVSNGIQGPSPFISPLIMNPENSNVLFTATNANIYKTTNGAGSWQVSANFANVRTMALDKINPAIVYAHAFSNNIWSFYRSDDGGTNWMNILPTNIPSWGVTDLETDPHQEGRIFATRNSTFPNQDHIKVSEDYGASWTDITNNLPDIKVNDLLVSPYEQDHIFLATDLGVYFSENGGDSWCPFNNNLPRIYAMHLHVSPADTTLRVATFGRGVWKTSLSELLVSSTEPNGLIKPKIESSVVPNPVDNMFTLSLETDRLYPIKGSLMDSKGSSISVLFEKSDPVMSINERIFLPPDLPAGIYFVRLQIGHYSKFIKLVKK